MSMERILVLEDDQLVRQNLVLTLERLGYDVTPAGSLAIAEEALQNESVDLMFLDIRLPDGEGTDLLERIQSRPKKPLVVFVTGHGTIESAVECMKNGALDYLVKPFAPGQLEVTLKRAENFNQLLKVNRYYTTDNKVDDESDLLGQSPEIEKLRTLIRKVARTQATVLIQGESGTGKELVARAICRQSPRSSEPFIKVNCAAVPEALIESEFFGHEKGSFTGATAKRDGRFELANKGTILLDEISEITPVLQAKLLRILQEQEFERVGGNKTIKVDVRVIATTNRNLEESVRQNEFRQDLYFRLNVVPIYVPPLRDRQGEVPILADHFMKRLARKHGSRVRRMSPNCVCALESHHWPGNVRELQNVIERGVILCGDGEVMEPEHLGFSPNNVLSLGVPGLDGAGAVPAAPSIQDHQGHVLSLAEIEKRQIFAALEETDGNRTHAAKHLGISIRTLRNKLNEYNVRRETSEPEKASLAAVAAP